jgi:hypothetical protein
MSRGVRIGPYEVTQGGLHTRADGKRRPTEQNGCQGAKRRIGGIDAVDDHGSIKVIREPARATFTYLKA